MAKKTYIIAVDFDGTLCENKWPEIGEPNLALIAKVKAWKAAGHKLILFTMREGAKLYDALAWCVEQGIAFDAVNDNLPELQKAFRNNPRKVYVDYYIDGHNAPDCVLGVYRQSQVPELFQDEATALPAEYI